MVKSRNGFPNMFISKDLQYREMRWVGGNRKHEEARYGNELRNQQAVEVKILVEWSRSSNKTTNS